MVEFVKEVELVAHRDDTYTIYVFKIVDTNEYIFCTRLPNWQVPSIDVGDVGFLQYQIVTAGEEYYDPDTKSRGVYGYSNVYFMNFVRKTDLVKSKEITL
jgi:hypothetical protein